MEDPPLHQAWHIEDDGFVQTSGSARECIENNNEHLPASKALRTRSPPTT